VYDAMRSNVTKGAAAEEQWNAAVATYKQKYPKEAEEFEGLLR
jgi:transketolase